MPVTRIDHVGIAVADLDAAIALYESAGYVPVAPFGHYAAHPGALFYGVRLPRAAAPPS